MRPARRRELARWLVEQYRVSERRAPSRPDSRDRPDAGTIRILAHLRVASSGRLDGQSQARIPAL